MADEPLIGQREYGLLHNRHWGIVTICFNAKSAGWHCEGAVWQSQKEYFEKVVSLGLVEVKSVDPITGVVHLVITSKGKQALRDRPKRIIMPSMNGLFDTGKRNHS